MCKGKQKQVRTSVGVINHRDLAGGLPVIAVGFDERDDGADDAAGEDGDKVPCQHGVVITCSAHMHPQTGTHFVT